MIVVHLVNRLPTRTLKMTSPIDVLERLFPKVRLRNGLPPRIFSYVCYVHLDSLSVDKLSVKALKCALVGYSNTQRGTDATTLQLESQ